MLLAADPTSTLESALPSVGVDQASVTPGQLVQAALRQEMEGNPSERQSLLQTALELDSNYAPARWHLGYVEFDGQWLSPLEVTTWIAQDPRYSKYREARPRYADRAEDHFDLTRWCHAHDLTREHRAHLLTAAHLEPNNPQWQQALGRSLQDGIWMTDEEIQEAKRRREQYVASYHEWKPKLHRYRHDIEKIDVNQESYEAQGFLAEVNDPFTISALEEVFSLHSERTALLAVDVLSRMEHRNATHSLVRHSVWSEWPSVRQQAIKELRTRDPNQFIPPLIEYLRPAHSKEYWIRLGNRRPTGIWLIQDFDTNHFNVAVSAPPVVAGRDTVVRPGVRDAEVQSQFAIVDAKNQNRLGNAVTALRETTDENLEANQEDWREWWANMNHYFLLMFPK